MRPRALATSLLSIAFLAAPIALAQADPHAGHAAEAAPATPAATLAPN